ncbi:hypothetical protein JW968_03640 [Candidatus Woesearchaeota archaeon]|nr:hypothetical protein [Candidatus Woesearchaeota archaeon]
MECPHCHKPDSGGILRPLKNWKKLEVSCAHCRKSYYLDRAYVQIALSGVLLSTMLVFFLIVSFALFVLSNASWPYVLVAGVLLYAIFTIRNFYRIPVHKEQKKGEQP